MIISAVICGRNDNYGGHLNERATYSINSMLETFDEVVYVDWNTEDGKNILTHIVYNNDRWPLELTSGMEKFIASLAIRVALINISNLPRPNFMCIDEGMGNLDSTNLMNISSFFDYLKSEFEFILIISHLDMIKDTVDNLIDINKSNGFSKVCI